MRQQKEMKHELAGLKKKKDKTVTETKAEKHIESRWKYTKSYIEQNQEKQRTWNVKEQNN